MKQRDVRMQRKSLKLWMWDTLTHDQRISHLTKNLPHQEITKIILNFLNILLVNYTRSPKWFMLHETKGAKLDTSILITCAHDI